MATARKSRSNKTTPNTTLAGSRALQDGIFAAIFAFLRVLPEIAKGVLFPAATAISVVNLYYRMKNYPRRKKIAGERWSLLSDFLATGAEIFAVELFLGVAFAGVILSPIVVPAIFIASIALRWLDHFVQSIYWGGKVFFGTEGTPEQKENRANRNTHLRLLGVFTGAALVIGLLLLAPPAFGLVLPLLAQTLIQAIGAAIMVANAMYMGREALRIRKKETAPKSKVFFETLSLPRESLELKEQHPLTPRPTIVINPVPTQTMGIAKLSEGTQRFADLRETFVEEDLLYQMEMNREPDGPRKLVAGFLDRAKKALKASLSYQGEVALTEAGRLPTTLSAWPLNPRAQTQRDKLHAVLLLEKLLLKGKFEIKDQKNIDFEINDVSKVAFYFKYNDKRDIPDGTMEKLFEAVNDVLTKPKFQLDSPERNTYLATLKSYQHKR